MKFPSKLTKLLENKYTLYFVFAVSILKLVSNMASGENEKVILFILVGIVASFFSKNMTIVLLTPLVLTSVYAASRFEGLENKEGDGDKDKEKETEKREEGTLPDVITGPDASDLKTDNMTLYKKNKRVDYASTLEDAYGDLNNILDSDGIKNLTGDTKKLMEQQKQLAGALKNMTPLITQAQDMLKGFDIKGLTDVAKTLTNPQDK